MTPGLKGISRIDQFKDADLKDKNVFIRCDFNVPMSKGKITDDRRIRSALPTIQYALSKGARVILASHFGRPEKKEDRAKFSLEPIAAHLGELLQMEVLLIEDPGSDAPKGLLPNLRAKQILLLENLRFDEGETENSMKLAQAIASYTDVYVNDAFGASHRAHASIEALPSLIKKKAIGFLISKEIESLDRLLFETSRPYYAILGGAKVSDKISVIENLIDRVDGIIIGGAMAYTFLAAQKKPMGASRVEKDKIAFAAHLIERMDARSKPILLPIDHVISDSLTGAPSVTSDVVIPEGKMGLDIGPKTQKLYAEKLKSAKTVFWNGPMGVFENENFSKGTFKIAEVLANLEGAMTIVGGGDSASAAEASGFAEKMTHISTGGGASLEYLQGDKLPGLEVLRASPAAISAAANAAAAAAAANAGSANGSATSTTTSSGATTSSSGSTTSTSSTVRK